MSTLRRRRFWRWVVEMLVAAAAGPPVFALIGEWFPSVAPQIPAMAGVLVVSLAILLAVRWFNRRDDPRRPKRASNGL